MLINAAYEHAIYCKFRRVIKYVFILINDLVWAAIYLGGPDRGCTLYNYDRKILFYGF